MSTDSVTCGELTCPADTSCTSVNPGPSDSIQEVVTVCATRTQIDDCVGKGDRDECGEGGRCYDGVCLDAGCGNRRTDPGEVCDDGNLAIGDGCTPMCNAEVCGNGFLDPFPDPGEQIGELCDDGNAIGHDGCNNACLAERPTWEQILPTTSAALVLPRPRFDHAMAYDISRGRVLMFGGLRGSTSTFENDNETWEYDGTAWVQRFPSVSPRARSGHAMAYDAGRRRIVMFGGVVLDDGDPTLFINFNDTWEWDGTTWTQIQPVGPVPPHRTNAAMVYDPVRKAIVMVGGELHASGAATPRADTWTWDGTSWTQLTTSGTVTIAGHGSIAFDPKAGAVIYGGTQNGANGGPTWSLKGTVWTEVAAQFAYPRSTWSYNPATGTIFAFGGSDGSQSLTAIRELTTSGWTTVGTISTRAQSASAMDLDRGAIVVFGGAPQAGNAYFDTYEWTSSLTTPTFSGQPQTRQNMAIANDLGRGVAVMYGGAFAGSANAETWELSDHAWVRRTLSVTVPARYSHSMAYDGARRETVLFGGEDTSLQRYDETWVYDGTTWTERMPAMSPPGRAYHASAYDAARKRVVIFGGVQGTGVSDAPTDTWEWDGTTWAKVATTGPAPRIFATMGYDAVNQQVVLVGGVTLPSTGMPASDTWVWDGTTWTEKQLVTKPAKSGATLAWDPTRRRLILLGGLPIDEVIWVWDGTQWRAESAAGPTGRTSSITASDPGGAGIVTFAGQDGSFQHNDLWRLRSFTDQAAYESCHEPSDLDGDSYAGCDDPDCWAYCTPFCLPGADCDATAPHCGDGTCNAALETHRMCPSDCTATARCGDFLCESPETAASCPGDCP